MKTMRKLLKTVSAAALMAILLLAAGCSGLVNEPGTASRSDGTVAITVGSGGARTLSPAVGDFEKYGVVITNAAAQNGKDNGDVEAEPELTDGAANVNLKPGVYTVTVTGYLKTNVVTEGDTADTIAGLPIAEGSATVTVSAGSVTPAHIVLTPKTSNVPKGLFEYSVTYPLEEVFGGYSVVSLALTGPIPVGGSAAGFPKNLLLEDAEGLDDDGSPALKAGKTVELAPGAYNLTTTIKTNKQTGDSSADKLGLVINEVVYIYSTLTTAYTEVFTEDDLSATLHFAGTVTVNDHRTNPANEYKPVKVYSVIEDLYNDDAGQAVAYQAITNWDAAAKTAQWAVDVPAYYLKLEDAYKPVFQFKLESDDATAKVLDWEGWTQVSGFGKSGKDDIATTIDLYGFDFTQPANGTVEFAGDAFTDVGWLRFAVTPDPGYGFYQKQITLNSTPRDVKQDDEGYYVEMSGAPAGDIATVSASFFTFGGTVSVSDADGYEPSSLRVWGWDESAQEYSVPLAATTDFTDDDWGALPAEGAAYAYQGVNSDTVRIELTLTKAASPTLVWVAAQGLLNATNYDIGATVVDLTVDKTRAHGTITANPAYVLQSGQKDGYPVVTYTVEPAAGYAVYGTIKAGGKTLIASETAGQYTAQYDGSPAPFKFTGDGYFTFQGSAWVSNTEASAAIYKATAVAAIAVASDGTETTLGTAAITQTIPAPTTTVNWELGVPAAWKYYGVSQDKVKFRVTWTSTPTTDANAGPVLTSDSAVFDPMTLPETVQLNAKIYKVTYTTASTGGSVTTVPAKANTTHTYAVAGNTVRVTAAPSTGYSFYYLSVSGASATLALDDTTGLVYTFTQPANDITAINPNFYALTGRVLMAASDQTYTISKVNVWGTTDSSTATKADDVDYGTAVLGDGTYSRTFGHPAGLPKAYTGYVYFEVSFSKAGTTYTHTYGPIGVWSGSVGTITVPVPAALAAIPVANIAAVSSSEIILTVDAVPFNAAGWNVHRVEGAYARKLNADPIPRAQTWYRDEGLTPDTNYEYKVSYLDQYGKESPTSAAAAGTRTLTVTPAEAAITGLGIYDSRQGNPNSLPDWIQLNWRGNTSYSYKRITKTINGTDVSSSDAWLYSYSDSISVYGDWVTYGGAAVTYTVTPVRQYSNSESFPSAAFGPSATSSDGWTTVYIPDGAGASVMYTPPALTTMYETTASRPYGVSGTVASPAEPQFYIVRSGSISSGSHRLETTYFNGQIGEYRDTSNTANYGGGTTTFTATEFSGSNAIFQVSSYSGSEAFSFKFIPVNAASVSENTTISGSVAQGEYKYYQIYSYSSTSYHWLRAVSFASGLRARVYSDGTAQTPGDNYNGNAYTGDISATAYTGNYNNYVYLEVYGDTGSGSYTVGLYNLNSLGSVSPDAINGTYTVPYQGVNVQRVAVPFSATGYYRLSAYLGNYGRVRVYGESGGTVSSVLWESYGYSSWINGELSGLSSYDHVIVEAYDVYGYGSFNWKYGLWAESTAVLLYNGSSQYYSFPAGEVHDYYFVPNSPGSPAYVTLSDSYSGNLSFRVLGYFDNSYWVDFGSAWGNNTLGVDGYYTNRCSQFVVVVYGNSDDSYYISYNNW
jgi:hypothetical protein